MYTWMSATSATSPAATIDTGPSDPRPRIVTSGGGDEGTRTPDPRDANAVLFQLSYIPTGAGV